ncbi:hypothetical protein WJX73_006763, partial [Symbiochloris irregularis]
MPTLWLFFVVAGPLIILAILWGLSIMPIRGTSLPVRLDVGLAWLAALSILLLVPTDVASTLQGRQPSVLSQGWRMAYWYGFIVQFTILPFHQELADSGHFHLADRCIASLRNNLVFYGILVGIGAAGLLLLILTRHLYITNVVGFCIASSNAFGLIAGIFLMGYGLVAIPKKLWRLADSKTQRRVLTHQAGVQADRAISARLELSKARALVAKVSEMFPRRDPMRKYMDKIVTLSVRLGQELPSAEPLPRVDDEQMDYFDRQDLGHLRRRLRTAGESYARERSLYLELVQQFFELEDVVRNKERWGQPFRSSRHRRLPDWAGHLEWWWKCCLHAWAFRLLALLAALLS